MDFNANTGKNLVIKVGEENWLRIPIKTHVVMKDDDLFADVIDKYTKEIREPDDIIFCAEKIVAITQGRAYPLDSIKPSWLAKFLVKFVHKSPYGIGLGSPHTMQLALEDVGVFRILLGCVAAAFTKPFGIRGVFYKVCGYKAAAIDGPCDYTLPPYNRYAKKAPENPTKVSKELAQQLGNEFVMIDANDLDVNILGKSSEDLSDNFLKAVFKDNPLGQTNEQTPVGILRKLKS
ncbi:MAG: coenzyme F420-0:L-glutamate ligase [Treponemataceae bacterium]